MAEGPADRDGKAPVPADQPLPTATGQRKAASEAVEQSFFDAPEPDADSDMEHPRGFLRRRRRHPLIALAVIGMSAYLMTYAWRDLMFFFQPREPADLGEASAALAGGENLDNRYVRLRGAPDRKRALLIERPISGFDSFFRLLGTKNRVFVQRYRQTRTTRRGVPYVHVGRVVRFDTLPYRKVIERYFEQTATEERTLTVDALAEARRDGAGSSLVRDTQGRDLRLQADQILWINYQYPSEWILQFSKAHFASAQAVASRLSELGLAAVPDKESSRIFWRYVTLVDVARAKQLQSALNRPGQHASIVPRRLSYTASWKQLRAEQGRLILPTNDSSIPIRYQVVQGRIEAAEPPREISAQRISEISVALPFVMSPEALVLVEGDQPGDNWYYIPLYLVLSAFILINLWSLLGRVRRSVEGRAS